MFFVEKREKDRLTVDWTTIQVLAAIFVATLIRSAFGFGEALVAVPLIALLMPVEVAARLAVLVSITVAAIVLVQDWRACRQRRVADPGHPVRRPLSILMLTTVAEAVVKVILAVIIISFSAYCLVSRKPFELHDDRLAWLFGFGAGSWVGPTA